MVRAVKVVPLADDAYGPRSFGAAGSTGSGRRVMGKVPSLVFDLEDLGDSVPHPPPEPQEESSVSDVVQKLQSLLEPWSEPEYMLLLHVRFAREDAAKRGQMPTVPELADTLRRLGYAVKIRTALGGGSGGACLRSLRHSFLSVAVAGPSGSMSYVLDPRFREQFEIAHTTPRYAKVLDAVGPEVVSSQDRLNKVVELLCSEMALAFQETGTPLPPWRQYAAMLSKWQPRRSEEVDVTAAMNNGAGLLVQPMGGGAGGGGGAGAANGGCGLGGAKRLTGPSTVAQRLMMLGVAQQQSNPSPISEGLECGTDQSMEGDGWESVGAGVSTPGSSASSLHLDWEDGGGSVPRTATTTATATASGAQQQQQQGLGGGARPAAAGTFAAPALPAGAVAVPQRTASATVAVEGPAAGVGMGVGRPPPAPGPRGKAIMDGIRAAAAALPHRRSNTWAG